MNVSDLKKYITHNLVDDHKKENIIARLLTHKDININVTNNQGITPIQIARHFKYTEIIKLLENKNESTSNVENNPFVLMPPPKDTKTENSNYTENTYKPN